MLTITRQDADFKYSSTKIGAITVFGGIYFLSIVMAGFITDAKKDSPTAIAIIWLIEIAAAITLFSLTKCYLSHAKFCIYSRVDSIHAEKEADSTLPLMSV